MKFFPAPPKRDDELGLDQQSEMFRDPLPGHLQVLAKLIQGLAILGMELIEQGATTGIGQGFEDGVHAERLCNQMIAYHSAAANSPAKPSVLEIERARPEIDDRVMRLQQFCAEKPRHRPGFTAAGFGK